MDEIRAIDERDTTWKNSNQDRTARHPRGVYKRRTFLLTIQFNDDLMQTGRCRGFYKKHDDSTKCQDLLRFVGAPTVIPLKRIKEITLKVAQNASCNQQPCNGLL
jgi:hypothetical protein